MPNSNNIIATCRDTPYSATSYDGTTFSLSVGVPSLKWKVLAGTTGKFMFTQVDITSYTVTMDYSITDAATWNLGILPTTQVNCIVVTSPSNMLMTYNGYTFVRPGIDPSHETYYLYGITQSRTVATWSRPAMQFRVNATAVVSTIKQAFLSINPKMYYRTMVNAVVGSVGTFSGVWKW